MEEVEALRVLTDFGVKSSTQTPNEINPFKKSKLSHFRTYFVIVYVIKYLMENQLLKRVQFGPNNL